MPEERPRLDMAARNRLLESIAANERLHDRAKAMGLDKLLSEVNILMDRAQEGRQSEQLKALRKAEDLLGQALQAMRVADKEAASRLLSLAKDVLKEALGQ